MEPHLVGLGGDEVEFTPVEFDEGGDDVAEGLEEGFLGRHGYCASG
jgi:hypothetical protein